MQKFCAMQRGDSGAFCNGAFASSVSDNFYDKIAAGFFLLRLRSARRPVRSAMILPKRFAR
jgi:hypothetical protein